MINNFPNFLLMSYMGTGVGLNFTYGGKMQALHAASTIRRCLDEGVASIEATAEAEEAWWHELVATHNVAGDEFGAALRKFQSECTPSYLNNEGDHANQKGLYNNAHTKPLAFFDLLARWRASDFEGTKVVRLNDRTEEESLTQNEGARV